MSTAPTLKFGKTKGGLAWAEAETILEFSPYAHEMFVRGLAEVTPYFEPDTYRKNGTGSMVATQKGLTEYDGGDWFAQFWYFPADMETSRGPVGEKIGFDKFQLTIFAADALGAGKRKKLWEERTYPTVGDDILDQLRKHSEKFMEFIDTMNRVSIREPRSYEDD